MCKYIVQNIINNIAFIIHRRDVGSSIHVLVILSVIKMEWEQDEEGYIFARKRQPVVEADDEGYLHRTM